MSSHSGACRRTSHTRDGERRQEPSITVALRTTAQQHRPRCHGAPVAAWRSRAPRPTSPVARVTYTLHGVTVLDRPVHRAVDGHGLFLAAAGRHLTATSLRPLPRRATCLADDGRHTARPRHAFVSIGSQSAGRATTSADGQRRAPLDLTALAAASVCALTLSSALSTTSLLAAIPSTPPARPKGFSSQPVRRGSQEPILIPENSLR